MGAWGNRFSALPVVTGLAGLALCVASACGGAASTPLDRPALTEQGDDQTAPPVPEASASSSGGGRVDATVSDDSGPRGDNTTDASDEPVDDGQSSAVEAGPDAAMCGICLFGTRCCMMPGAMAYGQCYSVVFGGASCL
jgi:hypothetical protein